MSNFKNYEELIQNLKNKIEKMEFKLEKKDFGRAISVGDGLANVDGLAGAFLDEVVVFLDNGIGIIRGLNHNFASVILLNNTDKVSEGTEFFRTGKTLQIPVGRGLIGRVIDPLGNPLDGKGPITDFEFADIEKNVPGIMERSSVCEPLQTGIKVIDTLIPIGLGQRQLILGDRQSGKTTIVIDTILNQKNVKNAGNKFAYCIYISIGQKASDIAKLCELFKKEGIFDYTTIVATTAGDPAGLQYIAPMAGVALGEYFRDRGEDALVIFDDLSKHADAYREITLLMRRSPSRGAYPGDIFYLHAKLLERAAKLNAEKGSGSLTMLPIIETQAGDIAAYIPTNVISITDGQIYLDKQLFLESQKPAVNIGLSVSRIGSTAQYKGMRKVSGRMKIELAQYREFESFSRSVSDLDQDTKNMLKRGKVLMQLFKQNIHAPLSFERMILILLAGVKGFLDDIPLKDIPRFEKGLIEYIEVNERGIFEHLAKEHAFNDSLEEKMVKAIKYYLGTF